jgi:pimeloyl-ACP methyl ester carboxylesterase
MAAQETTQRPADTMSEPTSELPIDLTLDSLMEEPTVETGVEPVEPMAELTVEPIDEPMAEPIANPTQIYDWRWEKTVISIAYETMGEGSPILLLPALSTISSRAEMRELGKLLSVNRKVYLLDWVGFGESDRPKIKYEPKVFRGLLRSFVRETFSEPIVVMAAGHTAGYVMDLVAEAPMPWSWVVLLAPTWRGPLPSMMGEGKRKSYRFVQGLVNLPIVGQFLYWLNTTQGSLKFMMKRHVYANAANITKDVLKTKQKITKAKGARFASSAFVTGALDPVRSSEDWLKHFQPLRLPVLMVIGEQMPPKSRKEDEIVANFSGVQVMRMPGSLSLHEEYPEILFAEISPFLEKYLSKKK